MTGLGIFTAGAVDPRVAASLDRLREEGKTQFTLPTRPPDPPPPQWLADLFRWLAGGGNDWMVGLAWLLVALLALGAIYLAVPSVRELVDRWLGRARPAPAQGAERWQPDAAASRDLLAEADALAAAGRYAEAAHLLLGRSIEDLERRCPGLLAPSLTARAIAGLGALPEGGRAALASIVGTVERGHWAHRLLGAQDWSAVRSAYERFAFGSHWSAAPA